MIRKLLTLGKRFLFFGVPLVLLLVGVIVWQMTFLYESIEPEEASPFRILLWICVRDLEKQPPEVTRRLLDRIETTVGRSSGEMPDLKKMDAFPRKIATWELQRRRNRVAGYTLAASGENAVKKNDAILTGKPLAERNIFYLLKHRYICEMDRYDAASTEAEKQAIALRFVEDLKWWQRFSENLSQTCGMPPFSLEEMVKEYEMAFEYYRKNTEPETYRRMLAFRDKLVVAEAKNRLNQFLGPIWGK